MDEALAGYCTHIEIVLQADGGVKVVDNGRGIPVDMHPTEHKPTVEVVMTDPARRRQVRRRRLRRLRRPARRRHLRGQRALQPGRHRGPPAGPRLADVLRRRRQAAGRPGPGRGDRPRPAPPRRSTRMPSIFETTDFDFETLRARFQQMAFLNKGLRITLTDERRAAEEPSEDGDLDLDAVPTEGEVPAEFHTVVYQYDDGLLDYVEAPELRQEGRRGPRGRHRLRNRGHGTAHRPGNGDAVDQRVLRERPHLRQHHQHARGRHPRRGLPRRDDLAHQPLCAGEEHHQGKGRQPHR